MTTSGAPGAKAAAPIVTVHLWGVPTAGIARAVLRMAFGRGQVRQARGLRFVKLVGTGTESFRLRDADPHHWGIIAAWDDAADARVFELSAVVSAWDRSASERARFVLQPIRSRGTWAGQTPFEPTVPTGPTGRVAAITRARIRPRQLRAFALAAPPVSLAASAAPGLHLATGIGEAPIGLQGTFSVWQDNRSLCNFVQDQPHARVVAATRSTNWYSEELFARFTILAAQGTFRGNSVEPGPTE